MRTYKSIHEGILEYSFPNIALVVAIIEYGFETENYERANFEMKHLQVFRRDPCLIMFGECDVT